MAFGPVAEAQTPLLLLAADGAVGSGDATGPEAADSIPIPFAGRSIRPIALLMSKNERLGLGGRVRLLREKHGWSQQKLAAMIPGVRQQSIDQLEQGKVARPRFLPSLAQALGVPEKWLLTGKGKAALTRARKMAEDLDSYQPALIMTHGPICVGRWS